MNKILNDMTSETNTTKFNAMVKEYIEAREQMKIVEDYLDSCKTKIQDYMQNASLDSITIDNYKVENKKITTQRMLKSNVPEDIWNKYSSPTTHKSLYVTRIDRDSKPRRRSKSRQRK